MEANAYQEQLNSINKKLDVILNEIEIQKRHRREMEDLKDDLMRVGKDVYQTALVELDQIHDSFDTDDLLHLGKRILRNVNTIENMFEQLESLKDFLEDATPLARDYFIDTMSKLDEFDRKGYFTFFKESTQIIDRIVTSFTPDDVKNLADNVVTILNTIKNLTQPDMLQTINTAVNIYKKLDIEVEDDVSIFKLFKEINTPEMKRGLSFAVKFLKSLSATERNHLIKVNTLQSN